eukprot:Clim_evm15s226 gene=Clim_evmTU15s226
MVRKLKYHEQKLLKKIDFYEWKGDQNLREVKILRRYHIQDREDYVKYNKLVGQIKKMVSLLSRLDTNDPFRIHTTTAMLDKLYRMGLSNNRTSMVDASKITASSFCRRRLPVVLVHLKMAETMKEAVTLVQHGHVRIGPSTVTDPAYLVPRAVEDFITWVDTSKIKRHVMQYNDQLDDFDLA